MVPGYPNNCPNCGGAIQSAQPHPSGGIQCAYCGQIISPPPQQQPSVQTFPPQQQVYQQPMPQVQVQQPSGSKAPVLIVAAAVLGIGVIGAILPIFMFSAQSGSSSAIVQATSSSPPPPVPTVHTPSIPSPGASMPGIAAPAVQTGNPRVQSANPAAMDISSLIEQTAAFAQTKNARARLSRVVANNVVNGMVNATSGHAGTLFYVFRYQDPGMPAGADQVEGRILVSIHDGEMRAIEQNHASSLDQEMDPPTCSSQSAWAAAVESGVEANAVATFHLYHQRSGRRNSRVVWSIRVEGHDEYRREIDAMDCSMVRNWGNR